mgnify:FL=1
MKKNNRLKERLVALYRRYKSEIDDAAQVTGLPPELIVAVIYHESGGNPKAVSRAGALGLMQLMPRTARGLGVTNVFDPRQNILGGARYLRSQLDRFNGNLALALAAYNAGPGNVQKYKNDIPPFRETQRYVHSIGKVLALGFPEVFARYTFQAPSLKFPVQPQAQPSPTAAWFAPGQSAPTHRVRGRPRKDPFKELFIAIWADVVDQRSAPPIEEEQPFEVGQLAGEDTRVLEFMPRTPFDE